MNVDSLTEEQARNILDFLARKCGAKTVSVDEHGCIIISEDSDVSRYANWPKLFYLVNDTVYEITTKHFIIAFKNPKTILSRILHLASEDQNDIFTYFGTSHVNFKKWLFMKAGTTLEQILIEMDLDI